MRTVEMFVSNIWGKWGKAGKKKNCLLPECASYSQRSPFLDHGNQ